MSEPAFPFIHSPTGFATDVRHFKGLSKRELFAAMAMQSFITQNFTFGEVAVARDSVKFADALIAELSK